MGAISDIVNMGDWTRMRMWGMAIGVAMIGFYGMAAAGLIDPSKTLYASNRFIWLSALVGGGMFGFGMVLASGCGSKTLVRIGGGNLKSLVVFVVMGVAAFATSRASPRCCAWPRWTVWRSTSPAMRPCPTGPPLCPAGHPLRPDSPSLW